MGKLPLQRDFGVKGVGSMKVGGFLFGSLFGAAAVVLISRRKSGMAALAGAAANRLFTSAGKVTGSGLSSSKSDNTSQAAKQNRYSAASSKESDAEVWSRLEAIVGSDPDVKKVTGKILDESVSKLMQSH